MKKFIFDAIAFALILVSWLCRIGSYVALFKYTLMGLFYGDKGEAGIGGAYIAIGLLAIPVVHYLTGYILTLSQWFSPPVVKQDGAVDGYQIAFAAVVVFIFGVVILAWLY